MSSYWDSGIFGMFSSRSTKFWLEASSPRTCCPAEQVIFFTHSSVLSPFCLPALLCINQGYSQNCHLLLGIDYESKKRFASEDFLDLLANRPLGNPPSVFSYLFTLAFKMNQIGQANFRFLAFGWHLSPATSILSTTNKVSLVALS